MTPILLHVLRVLGAAEPALLAGLLSTLLALPAVAQSIVVSGGGAVQAGGTHLFTATVLPAADKVTWSVNDVAGGDSTFGTITSRGLYRAPRLVPALNSVRIKATSRAMPSVSAALSSGSLVWKSSRA